MATTEAEIELAAFRTRARTVLLARLGFLGLAVVSIFVPAWARVLGTHAPASPYGFVFIAAYTIAGYLSVGGRFSRAVVFSALCLDLLFVVYLITWSGGLASPFMVVQVTYTLCFAFLFPHPLAILPPLLTLPIVARIDQILQAESGAVQVLLLLWYVSVNGAVVLAIVFLHQREASRSREVMRLAREKETLLVAEERARLAREIHDGLGAALSGLVLQADYAAQKAGPGEIADEIGSLRESAQEAIEELRRSVTVLKADFDLLPALEELVAAFGARTRMETSFVAKGSLAPSDPTIQLAVFRSLQECLTNAGKHSGGHRVDVRAGSDGSDFVVSVVDDGHGFHPERDSGGYGLENLRARAAQMGGSLEVSSAPGQGTRVTLRLPGPFVA